MAEADGGAPKRLELVASEAEAGERLDRFVGAQRIVASRTEAERLIREGRVLVEGGSTPKSYRLRPGDRVTVDLRPPGPPLALLPEAMELRVAFEDDHLLVVEKPSGLVVHPASGHWTGTLVHGLLGLGIAGGEEPFRPGVVHRLDKDTSGLLVVSRTAEAHGALQRLLRRRELRREYLALVRGRPLSWGGRIEAPIGRDRRNLTRQSLDTDVPRDAVTLFDVLELLPHHALLRVALETGRTHQIRVHLAAIDLPVAGDPVYGRPDDLGLRRQFLHAARLAFVHPFTGEGIDIESPLPADLEAALALARA